MGVADIQRNATLKSRQHRNDTHKKAAAQPCPPPPPPQRPLTERVCVLGAGSFGSAVAHVLSLCSFSAVSSLRVWARRPAVADEINTKGTNRQYIPEGMCPGRLFAGEKEATERGTAAASASASLEHALRDATVLVVAIPSAYLHPVLEQVSSFAAGGVFQSEACVVVNLVKSLHFDEASLSLTTVSDDIERALPGVAVTSLMGPNLYSEMVRPGEYAEATVGHRPADRAAALRVQRLFSATPSFCVGLCEDRAGTELCGGLKNVVSLAAGFCEGLGLGANARAAVIRSGLVEMSRLPAALGFSSVRESTILREACGVGDLVLTCTAGRGRRLAAAFVASEAKRGPCATEEASSRRWADLESELFDGMKLPDWHNALAVHRALAGRNADPGGFPLFDAVYRVAFQGAPPREITSAIKASVSSSSSSSAPATAAEQGVAHQQPEANLAGKRALVTGAGNGIGRAIVAHLASCGAHVTGLDVNEASLLELRRETGCSILVANLLDCAAAVQSVEDRMDAEGEFDLLVNNAGVARFEPILETTAKAFDFQYGVNVRAVAMLSTAVARALVAAGKPGSFVHISSQSSTLPLADHLLYSSSKAAVDHMARIQAFELGPHGIRVNTVRPTVVLTELVRRSWDPEGLEKMKGSIPLRRFARPLDVAQAVAWLLSDHARLVTGAALPVDGGRSMGGFGL